MILDECRKLSVPALKFSGNSVELGRACGIPFRVSVIALRAAGDADLSGFMSSSDYHSGSMIVSKPETEIAKPKETEKATPKKESKKKDETDKPAPKKVRKSTEEKKKDSEKVKSPKKSDEETNAKKPKKSDEETNAKKPKKVAKTKKSDDEE